jgi:uncharacterized membrane protein
VRLNKLRLMGVQKCANRYRRWPVHSRLPLLTATYMTATPQALPDPLNALGEPCDVPSKAPAQEAAQLNGSNSVRDAKLNNVRALALGTLVSLIALCLAWELFLAPLRPGGSWLALKALPLCLPIAGFLKHRLYTYRWVSLFIWLYVLEGLVRATSDRVPSLYYAAAEVVLSVLLFVICLLYVKLRFKY